MRVFLSAIALFLLAACGDDKPGAGISAEACGPWVAWKATRVKGVDAAAVGGQSAAICACITKAMNVKDALTAEDRAAVETYFSVFGSPVKRDPAYGHISQAGRQTLSANLRRCAKAAGFELE